jgi:hypothetical protein
VPDGCYVPGRRGLDSLPARPGHRDQRAPPVAGTVLPGEEPAAEHAGEQVRKPALLPVQGAAELDRPQLAVGRLGELHEDLVLRQGQAGFGLQFTVQPGSKQCSGPQVRAPGTLLVRGEPLNAHVLIVPGINDVSCMFSGA